MYDTMQGNSNLVGAQSAKGAALSNQIGSATSAGKQPTYLHILQNELHTLVERLDTAESRLLSMIERAIGIGPERVTPAHH